MSLVVLCPVFVSVCALHRVNLTRLSFKVQQSSMVKIPYTNVRFKLKNKSMCGIHKQTESAHTRGIAFSDHCKVYVRNPSLLWKRLEFPDDRTYSSMSIQQIDNSISLLINKFRQETKKNNGVPASRSRVWMAAYMKDGMSNSDSVNEVMTQMNELAEHMEGSSTDPAALQEQIFTQVMGPERPGRVRTFGLGPPPTDVFGGGYRRSQEQNRLFQTQVQEQVQEQLHWYQMQFESKMNEVMEKQIQAIRTDFQSRIQFLESQLQAAGVLVDPVVAPSNPLHRQQVVDSLSSHPTVRPMSHQQQSHAFSSQEMPVVKLRPSGTPDAMKSEGNDSLDTFIKQAIGKAPPLSFSRTGDNPVCFIE
ncbi:hypothetical protein TEA_010832 [Camellia sinensis var. sinensis]|uniref:Uncharacterized protein n=1 Tax=Camellia sinensis var. sinensis TaxID=542762 RepID=A0A4S4CYJ1_CAMSN|nr:hypothetical protein TEA_010832 [Camellia sinensis var. sinensis]